jgi:hypothetical protein
MSKFVGFVVGAALIVVGLTVPGMQALIVQGAAMIITQAVVDLTMPKTPARMAAEMQLQLGEQPRSALFGETFTPGSLVDGFNYGGKYGTDHEVLVIRLADHKCEGLIGFYVNDEYVLYTGDGNYPQFDTDHFSLWFRADTSNDPLPSVVTTYGPGWTSADIGRSGCDVVVDYKADAPDAKQPAWPGGRPRFGFVLRGKLCYDPRKDSTVTGGSGAHRWDDPTTWEWSENPIVCRYNWVRGIYAEDDVSDPTALLIGRGLTADEAPPENVIAPANLCDEGLAGPYPYVQRDASSSSNYYIVAAVTANWMARASASNADTIEWWNLPTKTLLGSTTDGLDAATGSVNNIDLANDGTAYFFGWYVVGVTAFHALWTVPPLGAATKTDTAEIGGGITRAIDMPDGTRKVLTARAGGFLDEVTLVSDAKTSEDFALHGDGSVWGFFVPAGSSNQFTLKRLFGGGALSYTVTGLVTRGSPSGGTFCHVADEQHFFVVVDGKFYLIHDDTTGGSAGMIKASGSFTKPTLNLPRKNPAQESYWAGYDLVSLVDASTIESVAPHDWIFETSSDVLYDPAGNSLATHNSSGKVTFRILGPGIRFRIAGPVYANQDFIDVEQMFAAAVAGNVITVEGSVELEPAQAKAISFSFTDDDLLVASEVNWNHGFLSQANEEWVNMVVSRYVEPTQQWNDHAAPPARDDSDIIADGGPREASIPLRLVRDVGQAQRIAEITRRLGRLWGRASVTLGPRFCEAEAGDWCEWTSDRYFGGDTKTFRIEAYQIDEKWRPKLTLREIASSVFADDVSYTLDQSNVSMSSPPPAIGTPDGGSWTLSATTLDSAGASVPALVVSGASEDDQAAQIKVEFWQSDGVTDPTVDPDAVPWTSAGTFPPDVGAVQLPIPAGGADYYAAVSYVVSGQQGDRLVLGPETAGDLDVSAQRRLTIDTISGTTYTVLVTDDWHHKRFTNGSAITVTVPTNATAAYPIGGRTRMTQAGAGQVTLSPAVGVTLNSRGGALKSNGAEAVFEIEKVGTDEWDVLGDVTT